MTTLATSNDKLQLVTGSAVSTDYCVVYSDVPGSTTDANQTSDGNITTATTTDIVSAPETRKSRRVIEVRVRNRHASTSQTVTLVRNINGSSYHLTPVISLAAGESFVYSKDVGLLVFDANGRAKTTGASFNTPAIMMSPTFAANDLTSTRTIGPGWAQATYVGKAPRDLGSATVRLRVTTAASVGGATEWAEVALAKGTPVAGGNPTLTVVGFTSGETALASAGMHNVIVSVQPTYSISEGDDVWVLVGSSAGTNPIIRAGLADNLQTGGHAVVSSRPSSIVGTATAFTVVAITVSNPWIAAIV